MECELYVLNDGSHQCGNCGHVMDGAVKACGNCGSVVIGVIDEGEAEE